ncbi:hypothetical protein POAN111098_05110 [Polynucleobacter antarcticus]
MQLAYKQLRQVYPHELLKYPKNRYKFTLFSYFLVKIDPKKQFLNILKFNKIVYKAVLMALLSSSSLIFPNLLLVALPLASMMTV